MTQGPQIVLLSRCSSALLKLVASVILFMALAARAEASSSVFLTPVADLGALPFSSESGFSSLPAGNDWVSYILGVSTDDGSKIQAVDVNLKGTFAQRWNWDADAQSFASTPNSLIATGGDSHLMMPSNALSPLAPSEDGSLLNSAGLSLEGPDSFSYGAGSMMRGVWAVPGIESATTSMNLAYLVIPRGSESQLQYAIDGAGSNGDMLFQFRQGAAFPPLPPPPKPLPLPPVFEPPIASPPIAPPSVDPPGTITPPSVPPSFPPPNFDPPSPQISPVPPTETPPAVPLPPHQAPGLVAKLTPVALSNSAASAGFTAYQLDAQSIDGSLIAAVDVSISGPVHQKWTNSDEEPELTATPEGRESDGGIDSHLTMPTGALVIKATEDNKLNSAAGSGVVLEGTGSVLSGVWGIVGDKESDFAHLAYLVLPADVDPSSLDVQLQAATPTGEQFVSLGIQPYAVSLASLVGQRGDLIWTDRVFMDSAFTGVGGIRFAYNVNAVSGGPSVPEPATIVLAGIALIGLIGLVRQR
jgi:hypothetical protein